MFLAPWLVCALIAWFMWWYWQRQKRIARAREPRDRARRARRSGPSVDRGRLWPPLAEGSRSILRDFFPHAGPEVGTGVP
jgi:hypothetical protein